MDIEQIIESFLDCSEDWCVHANEIPPEYSHSDQAIWQIGKTGNTQKPFGKRGC